MNSTLKQPRPAERLNILNTCGVGTTQSSLQNHKITNALTIDVEDYFHIQAFAKTINPADWDHLESIVEKKTYHVLDLLDSTTNSKPLAMRYPGFSSRPPRATFFVLGWVAERYPELVKEICTRGHEVACHGYAHKRIFNQTPKEFKEDVRKAKGILEDLTGTEVIGYRAPTYSITRGTLWALSILFELGFRYDSSIFPIRHDFYGLPEAPRFPFCIDFSRGDLASQFRQPRYLNGAGTSRKHPSSGGYRSPDSLVENSEPADTLTSEPRGPKKHCSTIPLSLYPQSDSNGHFVEFPLSTVSLFGRNLPCSGGGYFRLFPYRYTRWGFRTINDTYSESAIFYIHPWEFDPELPVIGRASLLSRFRTYVNLKKTEGKFRQLLSDFEFAPLISML